MAGQCCCTLGWLRNQPETIRVGPRTRQRLEERGKHPLSLSPAVPCSPDVLLHGQLLEQSRAGQCSADRAVALSCPQRCKRRLAR